MSSYYHDDACFGDVFENSTFSFPPSTLKPFSFSTALAADSMSTRVTNPVLRFTDNGKLKENMKKANTHTHSGKTPF